MRLVAASLAGLVFGAGLAIADMTNPAKVQNFLDVLGSWDPSLAFVMGTALAVAAVGFAAARQRPAPPTPPPSPTPPSKPSRSKSPSSPPSTASPSAVDSP